MSHDVESQKKRILKYIKKHGFITNRDAAQMEIYRLSARILDLRNDGEPISTEMVYSENARYGRYYLKA